MKKLRSNVRGPMRGTRPRDVALSLHGWAALAAGALLPALFLVGCPQDSGAPASAGDQAAMPHRVASTDGSISIVLEGDLLLHAFEGAVAATAPDGLVRVYVERLEPMKLIRLAGAGKDAFAAHGWEVSQEQHFEQAIRVELVRGGLAKAPAEKRDVWWVARPAGVYLCDAIARAAAFGALGAAHKARCLSVELKGAPQAPGDDAVAAPAIDGDAAP